MSNSTDTASQFFSTNINALSSKLLSMSNELTENQKAADIEIVICNSFNRLHDTADLSWENITKISAAVAFVNTAIHIGDQDKAKLVANAYNPESVHYANNFLDSDFDVSNPENVLSVFFDISMSAL